MSAPDNRQTKTACSAPHLDSEQQHSAENHRVLQSFPGLSQPDAQFLILGSMPGTASLRAHQYYAHPRNVFWKIMGELLDFDHTQSYATRVQHLLTNNIALWDVAQHCVRPGSLDSAIVASSVVANNFGEFFAGHPQITRVCLNGGKAAALYRRHVLSEYPELQRIGHVTLPSTSPANAGISYPDKVSAWRAALSG